MGEGDPTGSRAVVIPDQLSLLPIKDTVLFPMVVMPLIVSRESSMKLVDDAVVGETRIIALAALNDPNVEAPRYSDVYHVGVAAAIHTMLRLPEHQRLIVQGLKRVRFTECIQSEPYLRVKVEEMPDERDWSADEEMEIEATSRKVATAFQRVVALSPNLPDELQGVAAGIQKPGVLADTVALHLPIPIPEKQELLEIPGTRQRLRTLLSILMREIDVLELGSKIQSQVHSEMGKTQREYYLREQMKAIQRELGETDERTAEAEELRAKVEEARMPEEATKEAMRELDRLSRMPPAAPEYTVARTFIDSLVSLPWNVYTQDNLDIPQVHEILDEDHYGLDKVKDRILEYLSVRKFKAAGEIRHPILCFAGPPGVGKTSLGKSIARALGRNFVRMSLGGIRDEAEIRGHRRTYIGALPGQIVQGIKRAGSHNPVFMLDEIDKVGADFRGDPSSALLEVLDPEQNSSFRDHYLEVTFDLSKVLFITTANVLDTILPPLRDRMEILEIAGYTEEEKLGIAVRHLIPKQLDEHGLKKTKNLSFTDKGVLEMIRGYTREAGVRNLERQIAAICRKAARAFAEGRMKPLRANPKLVQEFLGAPRYTYEELADRTNEPGVAVGLAWTPTGGDVLFVEATRMEGGKQLIMTGQLGDVMKESAQAALSYVRSHSSELGVDPKFYKDEDIHLHVPAGAIPKDGPSAGVTIVAALASLLSGKRVKPRVAMTGEITLRGKVLPVGGIKEKILAARRAGVETVIVPKDNRKDVMEEVPANVREAMKVEYVDTVSRMLELALDSAAK
ncbi:MAG: endopeptidase La [Armatimonadetes bacterium RBG_16_58_9]|nr:MAG: endopeptidase La [Armatimonadetes bacterium RBG_16_58_9]